MRTKLALLSGLISTLCALPALASPTTPPGHYVQHAAAAGVICPEDDYSSYEATTVWTSNNLNYKFTMTLPADTYEYLGLRLTGANSQQARSFQLDVNDNYGDYPYIEVFVDEPGYGPSYVTGQYLYDAPGRGFTAVNLPNGFTRWTFNAASYGLPKGSAFNAIYLWDYNDYYDVTYSDVVANISVNGYSVLPILNPYPVIDCNWYYLPY